MYHTIHPANTARGGSCVIIRENIKHYEELDYSTEMIQAATVRIQTKRIKCAVSAIYSPPRHNIKYEDYKTFLNTLGENFILGGDFNAKHTHWGSRLTTAKGKELLTAGSELKCEFLSSGTPSYWPSDVNKLPDLIDFFITKGISSRYMKVDTCMDLSSDHTPVILTLSDTIISKHIPNAITNKHTNWNGFKNDLEELINLNTELKTNEQLEKDAVLFTEMIQLTAKENTPPLKLNVILNKNYPLEIKAMILEKRKARKKWTETRNPQRKTEFNRLSQQLKRLLRQHKEEGMSNFLKGLNTDKDTNYSLWRTTKRLKRTVVRHPPIRKVDGMWARSNQEKADTHADHLENVFKPHSDEDHELPPVQNQDDQRIKPVTPQEVNKEIKNLNLKKSPGYDLVTSQILKELPPKGIMKLTHLFNSAIRLRYVPRNWKRAEIITLPKPGKTLYEVSSYRPISLLPIISKVFERLIMRRLTNIIENKQLIPAHQFGFRHKHSTIDQVHRITARIENALEEKKVCSAVFLDVSQAFDKVWHEGLNYKLNTMLPKSFALLLKSYLEDRTFSVRYEDCNSTVRKIRAGVPQGSVLGPTLYLLYTSDIPKFSDATTATFADDTAILATGINTRYAAMKLQRAVNKAYEWTKEWRIKLNETKSQHVNFTYKKDRYVPIHINQQIVPFSNTAKYLGMNLDSKLKWKEHIKIKIKQLNTVRSKLDWLTGRKSNLSIDNKMMIYKQIVKPVWLYGIQLWGCSNKTNVHQVQIFQNKMLRSICNAPWYCRDADIHNDLYMVTINEARKSAVKKHQIRISQHINRETSRLFDTDGLVRRLKRIKPVDLLT